jgi:hypothetical protein
VKAFREQEFGARPSAAVALAATSHGECCQNGQAAEAQNWACSHHDHIEGTRSLGDTGDETADVDASTVSPGSGKDSEALVQERFRELDG